MARSQFSFVVAVPDPATKSLEVVSSASVKIRYRNPDPSETEDYPNPEVTVYAQEFGTSAGDVSDGQLTPDSNGRVFGWLEDGRYRLTITSTTTPASFSPISQDFDIRSGGEFAISSGGVSSSPSDPQIYFDDDRIGDTPSIKLGSGSAPPDVMIKRAGDNELVIDSSNSGLLSTTIIGDVKLAGSGKVLDVNNSRVQNLGPPLAPSDAANKGYVDAAANILEPGAWDGKVHNMSIFNPMGALTAADNDAVYFSRLNVPLGVNIVSLDFIRASGDDSVGFQFGVFAEYNNYNDVHKMVCLAATKLETTTWDASAGAASYELPIGIYENTDEDEEDLEFVPQSFFYGSWVLQAGFTGSLYAGIITSINTVQTLGADITSPILSGTLGLEEVNQFPLVAGITTTNVAELNELNRYKGADQVYRILGGLDLVEDLEDLSARVGDAYIIDNSVWIYGTDIDDPWYEGATAVDFPARSTKVPFVRVRV